MIGTKNRDFFQKLHQTFSENKIGNFRMVAFDMDGTLLNQNHLLSEQTIETVKKVASKGILVLLATARMTSAVKKHLEKLGTPGIVVSHDGALVKDVTTGKVHYHKTIPKNVVVQILELIEENNIVAHFNFDDNIYLTAPNPYSEVFAKELGVSLKQVSSFKYLEGTPTSILIIDVQDVLKKILLTVSARFQGKFNVVMAPWRDNVWRLQFTASNTSKGKGVLQVAKYFDIKPEEIVSFGDNYNDIDMIESTGFGIAMENAVPELKQVADFVTLSNQEDGVACVLEALFR